MAAYANEVVPTKGYDLNEDEVSNECWSLESVVAKICYYDLSQYAPKLQAPQECLYTK